MFFTGNYVDSTKKYGDSVSVDFGNYVFGAENTVATNKETEDALFNPIDNLDERGNFKINKYKISY